MALNFRSTRLTCDCVIQGLNSGFDMSVVDTLVWLNSGFYFGVCVGKCFAIISSHVSFPISVYFPDASFSVVTFGWMLVVKFFYFLGHGLLISHSFILYVFIDLLSFSFLFFYILSVVFCIVSLGLHFSYHFYTCHKFW